MPIYTRDTYFISKQNTTVAQQLTSINTLMHALKCTLCVSEAVTGSSTALTTWWPSGDTKGLTWCSDACLPAHESRWLWSELCGVNAWQGQLVCPCQSGASQPCRPDVGLKVSCTEQSQNRLNHTEPCTVKEHSQLFLETDSNAKCINVNESCQFLPTCGPVQQCDKAEKSLSLCKWAVTIWKCGKCKVKTLY